MTTLAIHTFQHSAHRSTKDEMGKSDREMGHSETNEFRRVYVALLKEFKEGEPILRWVLRNTEDNMVVVVTHVYSSGKQIPPPLSTSVGSNIPDQRAREQELRQFRKTEMDLINKTLDKYILLCTKAKKRAEKLVIEVDDVSKGLAQLISKQHVTELVMGAASDKHYSRFSKTRTSMSKTARNVQHLANPSCKISFISKGKLVSVREPTHVSIQSETSKSSEESSTSYSQISEILSDSREEPEITMEEFSPFVDIDRKLKEPQDYQVQERPHESISQTEYSKLEAFERHKIKLALVEAMKKIKVSENLFTREMKKREEIEEKLKSAMTEVEMLREEKTRIMTNLQAVTGFLESFSLVELKQATRGFNASMMIGEGRFGSVYRSIIRNTPVAVKILNKGILHFESGPELILYSRMRHPNIVPLLGVCKEAQALVYEYLPNGNLEDRLLCKDNRKPLTWQQRICIASDMCSALIFLHSANPPIVHANLKPSNILLDSNYTTKLSDFGTFGLCEQGSATTTLFGQTHPKGTYVYMDPDYLLSGEMVPSSDIYSFGFILLRLLTGRSPFGLVNDMKHSLENGTIHIMLDRAAGNWPVKEIKELARVGVKCCEIRRKNRPDLVGEVMRVIEPIVKSLPVSCMNFSSSRSFKSVSDDFNPPSYFICPINQDIMGDPLIAADGFTYEGEAIKGWFQNGHVTSPMTNIKLAHCELIPNHALRSAIQEWIQFQE